MPFIPARPARIAAAVLGASAALTAHAQSQVQLSGLVDMAVGSYELSGGDRTSRAESGGMTTSYLGFSGSEDLGGGLKAVFALDTFLRADTGEAGRFGGDVLWARNSNVGLSGSFGSVHLGRKGTPLFVATLLFNPFGDSFGFSPAIRSYYSGTGTLAGDSGWSNSIAYTSPKFGGATVNLAYSAKEGDTGANVGGNVLYFGGPLAFSLAAQKVKKGFASGDQVAYQAGVSYTLGGAKLFGQYGQIDEDSALEETKDKIFQVGASVKIGDGSLLASYGQRKASGDRSDKRKIGSVGYDYFLSKRTDVYAVYMYDKLTNLDSGNTIALGLRHRF